MDPRNARDPGASRTGATPRTTRAKRTHQGSPLVRDLAAWQLAELLDPDSLVLHDTPSFSCPQCRTPRSCWPLSIGFRCDRCGLRQTKDRLAALVRQDPDAMARYRRWYRLAVAS